MKSTWLLIVGVLLGLFCYQSIEDQRVSPTRPAEARPTAEEVPDFATRRPLRSLIRLEHPDAPPKFAKFGPAEKNPLRNKPQPATATTRLLPPLPSASQAVPPSQAELEISAALTGSRAGTELDRLHRLLDLTREQADEIYLRLARQSRSYDPSLRIRIGRAETSSPTPLPSTGRGPRDRPERDPEEELEKILTPEQNQELLEEQIEADQWWSEILDELASNDTP